MPIGAKLLLGLGPVDEYEVAPMNDEEITPHDIDIHFYGK